MKPLVSILCPTYNAEKFIKNTISSIVSQDYENIQIIVSDDCSSDRTVQLVRALQNQYPGKIVLNVNNINLGITKNCNVALSLCTGKYVCFFAGDDIMYDGKVSAQVILMEKYPSCSLSYHPVHVLDGDNNNQLIFTTDSKYQTYKSVFDVISRAGIIGASSIMVRTDCIPQTGFSEKLPNVSDWLMHIEIALRGKILKIPIVYSAYIRHAKGASRKTFETLNEVFATCELLNDRFAFAPQISKVTDRAFSRYIMGEISRLFIFGDTQRLRQLKIKYCFGKPVLYFAASVAELFASLNINKLTTIKKLYVKLMVCFK